MVRDGGSSSPEEPGRLPRIVRLLAYHGAVGVGLGVAFAMLLLLTNPAGLTDLIMESDQPWLPIVMLSAGCALTFGSASMGAAIMTIHWDDDQS